jgi:hypothetical protein
MNGTCPAFQSPTDPGECWVVPNPCPINEPNDFWVECYKPARWQCHTLCQAISDGWAHQKVMACMP